MADTRTDKLESVMFSDSVKIEVRAGKGGNGAISFRREKFIPKGGPNGGDGGKGGDIIFEADSRIGTLIDLYNHPHQRAKNGENGGGSNKTGKEGEDLIIKVPLGTVISEVDSDDILADLVVEHQKVKIAQGGQGGKGNYRFKSSIRRRPRFAQKGEPGEVKKLVLILKIIADIGLVGFPNVGKSTLLSRISSAKPKIADYPFTTIDPNLGVVRVDESKSFVVADIPGLIEGAHQGTGLGDKFLKHIERTKIILHVIDASKIKKINPLVDLEVINSELKKFSKKLVKKPMAIAINKCDLSLSEKDIKDLEKIFKGKGYKKIYFISALLGKGLKELIYGLSSIIDETVANERMDEKKTELQKIAIYQFEPKFNINKNNDIYEITGKEIEKIAAMTDFNNEEALEYFQKIIKKMGLKKALIKKGIREGELVKIKEKSFYFFY